MSEAVESLTGYDEQAIEKHYGGEISTLMGTKPTMGIRSLIFIQKTREGLNAVDAKKVSMELSMKDAMTFFAENEDEPMPEDPVTEEGKESGPYGIEQAS